MPTSQACSLTLALPSGSFLVSGACPTTPQAVPQCTGTETGLSPCRASNSVVSPAHCPVSGTLKWPPPFLSSQAFLHAGMTRPHVLPWGSHQSLDRKVIHRCQPIMELQLPPRTPSFPLLPLPLSPSSFHSPLPPLTYWYCHLLT